MAQTMTASRKDARGQAMDSRVEQGAQSLSSRPGQALGGSHADAQPGKGAGSRRHRDHVHLLQPRPAVVQQVRAMGSRVRLWVRPLF